MDAAKTINPLTLSPTKAAGDGVARRARSYEPLTWVRAFSRRRYKTPRTTAPQRKDYVNDFNGILGIPWIAVDDPFAVAQRCQIGCKSSGIGERSELAEELELSGLVSTGELLQDQPAEQAREDADVDKEVGPAGNPALTIKRDAAARYDHVDVGVMAPTPTIP
jgi:hypothetical protein